MCLMRLHLPTVSVCAIPCRDPISATGDKSCTCSYMPGEVPLETAVPSSHALTCKVQVRFCWMETLHPSKLSVASLQVSRPCSSAIKSNVHVLVVPGEQPYASTSSLRVMAALGRWESIGSLECTKSSRPRDPLPAGASTSTSTSTRTRRSGQGSSNAQDEAAS